MHCVKCGKQARTNIIQIDEDCNVMETCVEHYKKIYRYYVKNLSRKCYCEMHNIKHAKLKDWKEIYKAFEKHRKIFPLVRPNDVMQKILEGKVIFEDGVVIVYGKYEKKTTFGNITAVKGDWILQKIVKTNDGANTGSVMTKFLNNIDTRVYLRVLEENGRARSFYEKHGMRKVGDMTWKEGTIKGNIYSNL